MELHLVLKKKWFDLHLTEKEEEYRTISPYWCSRLLLLNGNHLTVEEWKLIYSFIDNRINPFSVLTLTKSLKDGVISFKQYDKAIFSNGMKSIAILPRFDKQIKKLSVGIGNKNWGAVNDYVFIISCGKAVNITNR